VGTAVDIAHIQNNMGTVHYISGGMRSGKSTYGMKLGLDFSEKPIYLATARRWDKEFDLRIKKHDEDRNEKWRVFEIEKFPSKEPLLNGQVIVVDCLTLWLTNFFIDSKNDVDYCLNQIKLEINDLKEKAQVLIIISNEIGMGLHAESESGRKFTDLQGWANQFIADLADHATFMVSGQPLTLK